jgi:rubrerythrin
MIRLKPNVFFILLLAQNHKIMQTLLQNIVNNDKLHCLWLNTLSFMENAGARKIKRCEHPIFVTEMILKHAAEEARHAYYLKKQIGKISPKACPSYERKYLLSAEKSMFYLHELDISVSRILKNEYGFSADQLRYAAYLLVTYAIELRADELYPIYQDALDAVGSKVNVKSIIAEEINHLKEMRSQLAAFSERSVEMCRMAEDLERKLFADWIKALENVVLVPMETAAN